MLNLYVEGPQCNITWGNRGVSTQTDPKLIEVEGQVPFDFKGL